MTKKEEREYKEDLFASVIEGFIKGAITKLNNKNKKLLKDLIKQYSIEERLLCSSDVRASYYSWAIDSKEDEINSNFDRLIYLMNDRINYCEEMLKVRGTIEISCDEALNIKSAKDAVPYSELAEEVGL